MSIDLQKRQMPLDQLLKVVAKKKQDSVVKTKVDSADTLDNQAKALVVVNSSRTAFEEGKWVRYSTRRTLLDTWVQDGLDWKLIETRLTSNLVTRDGKVVANETEKVLTDWQRSYGRNATWTRKGS